MLVATAVAGGGGGDTGLPHFFVVKKNKAQIREVCVIGSIANFVY